MIFVQSLEYKYVHTYVRRTRVKYATLTQCHILHSEDDDDDVGRDNIMVPRSSCLSEDTAKTLGSYHMYGYICRPSNLCRQPASHGFSLKNHPFLIHVSIIINNSCSEKGICSGIERI